MKKILIFLILFTCISLPVFAANLTVSGSSTATISTNATYDLVIIEDQGKLIVTSGATLRVTGCLVGYDDSSFVFNNCTVDGRINIESSSSFQANNAMLTNTESTPTNSIITSENILIVSSQISAIGPVASYYTAGGEANITIASANTIVIKDSEINCTGGVGVGGYYGPKPDGPGTLSIESETDIYIENNSTLSATGYSGQVNITCDMLFARDSFLEGYGRTGASGRVTITASEVNNTNNSLYAEGGDGMPGGGHGGYLYAMPTNGGYGLITLTGDTVNLDTDSLHAEGSNGGAAPYGPWAISPGSPGGATITINSMVTTDPSLYNWSYTLVGPGPTSLTITPPSIDGAPASTVHELRRVLDDFSDNDLWSPDSTCGWWDIDGTLVYQHAIVSDPACRSFSTMQTDFSKAGYSWSLFGGYLSAANANRDFTSFNTVRVWIQGNSDMLLKLRDGSYVSEDVGIQQMSASNEVAPLDFNYSHLSAVDLANVDNVLIFADPGNPGTSGTFYIDTIELINSNILENFEDANMWSPDTSFGWWDIDGALVYSRSIVTSPRHEGSYAMRVDFNKSGRPWSLFGGSISSGNSNKDFSGYRKMGFWLYGDVDLLVKLRDRTYAEEDVATVSGVAGQWTYVEVAFSDLTIDLTDIDNVLFFVAPGDGSATGTFYLDDLKLLE